MEKNIFMELLAAREFKAIRSILNVMNAVDIASLLSEFEEKELAQAFRLIPKAKAAEVFANMSNVTQSCLIDAFTETELKEIIDDMFMDDTVDLLEDLPANVVTRILSNINPQKRAQINILLDYPQDSAGSIMTTEYVSLKRTCYVLEARRLVGIVTAKDLMVADDDKTIEELMRTEIIFVHTGDDQEQVGQLFSKYDLLALPVLDTDECMVGIVTVDDALDVVVDEATEDMSLMAAVNPSEKSYFETPVLTHAKNRIVWLLVLMLSATATGVIITHYENAFAAVPILVSFIPMLMDTGGNCGSQSSTLIIRGIALGEITFRDIFKVMFKEFRISIIVGVILALANGLRILLMYRNFSLAVVISISLVITVIFAKLIGCILPLLAKKLHFDPAIMASPLITTIVDTCSILIYFNVATVVFHL